MSYESRFENKYKNYKEEFIELLDEFVEGSLPVLPEMRAELDEVYAQAAKADEYEAKNKELLEELKYLKKVNDDLVWQRDTDEEHEAKARAFDRIVEQRKETGVITLGHYAFEIIREYESGESDA